MNKTSTYKHQADPLSSMYAYQNKLPMLPVPTLSDTCEKYWDSVQPFLHTDADRKRTRLAIEKFLVNPRTNELQQQLLARQSEMAKHGKSWFIDWWNDYAYMGYRDSVVINVNYFFQFKDDVRRIKQTGRAASIISSALEFRDQVVHQILEPDMAGRGSEKSGLCMHQYQYMFNACRVPEKPSDTTALYDPEQYKHIAVTRKGQIFTMNVCGASGKYYTEGEFEAALDQIKSKADAKGWQSHPLTALTTENRDQWTDLRQSLISKSSENKVSLEKLESAIFVICLDDYSPVTREEAGRALWHGDGLNRYFDKSIQFVVFENGKAGFNGEHSMMDATPTFRMCDYVCSKTLHSSVPVKAVKFLPHIALLKFESDKSIDDAVDEALKRFKWDVDRHDHKVLAYFGYGKNTIKKFGLSPDSFVQLSIQLAYFRLFGHCRATYESAQTKKYAWGRTEVCRSVTSESVAFCKSMADPELSAARKAEMARAAIKQHVKVMASAVDGRGIDRHLLGLRMLMKKDEPQLELFADPTFKQSSTWYLSTSQITSEDFDGYGWGEVVPDGYGIAYMVKNNSLHYNVAALKGGEGFEAGPGSWDGKGKGIAEPTAKMVHCLQESLNDMREIFEATMEKPGVGAVKAKL